MEPLALTQPAVPTHPRRGWAWAGLVVGGLVAAGAIVAALITGVSSDGGPVPEPGAPAAAPATLPVAPPAGSVGASMAGTVSGPVESAPLRSPQVAVPAEAATIRTADMQLEVPSGDFSATFDRVASAAPAAGGLVAASTSTVDDAGSSGQLVLRVPADRFDGVRQAISRLGTVQSESVRGEDVSTQLVDFEARGRALQLQEETLTGLVARATTVGEVVQVQPALSGVRQQIEQLQAQQRRLERASALSTIVVSLREPGARAVGATDEGLGARVEQAVDAALAVVGGIIVVVGWVAPVLVLALAAYVVLRARRAGLMRSTH